MNIYINNTRTFKDYFENYHHHDLMLANGCMAGVYDDQEKVNEPQSGDVVALYVNRIGLVAYGYVGEEVVYVDDDRVGGHPTKLRQLIDFRFLAYPIRETEYETSNTQTLQQVHEGKADLWELLQDRSLPSPDPTLFKR